MYENLKKLLQEGPEKLSVIQIADAYQEAALLLHKTENKYGNWISVETLLPPSGKSVLAVGTNYYGKARIIKAFYAPKGSVELGEDDQYEAGEMNDNGDTFLKEGWYESNEFEDVHWLVGFKITHWMPLPEAPAVSDGYE